MPIQPRVAPSGRLPIPAAPRPGTRQAGVVLPHLGAPPRTPSRSRVVQLSNVEEKKAVSIQVAEGSERKPEGMPVSMGDIGGKTGFNLAGLYTYEVRNCVVFCAFEGEGAIDKIFMLHTPHQYKADVIAEAALPVVTKWKSVTSYIIGGNNESLELNTSHEEWSKLNVVGVKVPLTKVGQYANIEMKGCTITYWVHED